MRIVGVTDVMQIEITPLVPTGKVTRTLSFEGNRGIVLLSALWYVRRPMVGVDEDYLLALTWNSQRRGLTSTAELLGRADNIAIHAQQEGLVGTAGLGFGSTSYSQPLHRFPIIDSISLQHVFTISREAGVLLYFEPVEFTLEEWAHLANRRGWRLVNEPEIP